MYHPAMVTDTFTRAYRAQRAATKTRQPRVPLLARAGNLAAKALPRWDTIRRAALSLGGLGGLTAAAWTVALPLGLTAAGLSLLVLEWLTGGDR